eukprot:90293_1
MYYFYLIFLSALSFDVYGKVSDEMIATYKENVERIYVENNNEFFKSKEYLNVIPKDPNWIKNKLVNIPKQYASNKEADEELLDSLDISTIEPQHKYSKTVQEALDLFHKWRKWGNEWTEVGELGGIIMVLKPPQIINNNTY